MTQAEQKTAAKKFAEYWKDKGDEKQETSSFWIELLTDVLGGTDATKLIDFEKPVIVEKNQKYIDGYISSTKILIEQKSSHIKLERTAVQSDGEKLTPYGQAFRYNNHLPYDQKAKWIIVSNFTEILIYNMNKPNSEPERILLKDLPKEYYRLQFMVNTADEHIKKEMEVSLQAGELVGKLYNAILKQYKHPDSPETLRSLNKLCVRLVFCLYAEDAGIFGRHGMFHDYLKQFPAKNARKALIELFHVLDQKPEERDPYDETMLSEFPYVNGGLFEDEDIEIPNFNEEILDLLLNKASDDFDWSLISPTIFGAVFESTLNPETRRSGGMHYTSIENIRKVIDPLFMDGLRSEFEEIKESKQVNVRTNKLQDFQRKLASLKFLDPACGSGNFLTQTYIELRRLENEIIRELHSDQMGFNITGSNKTIHVSIGQFYGIEINDFAVTVAKTALWIAESQMMKETEEILGIDLNFLPLKSYANIREGNALRIDWESVVPKSELSYIMGNPPFIGKKEQTKEQKADLKNVFLNATKKTGILDYVSAWFYIASNLVKQNPNISVAFVSTDSICQGEHVPVLWQILIENNNVKIDFAYKTFKWSSEAKNTAEVYCIIVGFSSTNNFKELKIYDDKTKRIVKHINPYLVQAPNIWIQTRSNQISGHNKICYGSMPIDNGFLILSQDEYSEVVKKEPITQKFIRKYAGAEELLKGKIRYCLWLENINRKDILSSRFAVDRISKCKDFREKSNRSATRKLADTPELFGEIRQPESSMLVIPKVSSKHRKYIPVIPILNSEYIINGSSLIIANGSLLEFGILSSNVHNAWLRVLAETWGHSYQYSTDIYNNFPFPMLSDKDILNIEATAQKILDIRSKNSDLTIAEMYNPKLGIISELLKAHQQNDFAVMAAYGFDRKITESEIVAELMKMYRELMEGI